MNIKKHKIYNVCRHPMCIIYIHKAKATYTHGRLMYHALFIVMDVGNVVVSKKNHISFPRSRRVSDPINRLPLLK